MKTINGLESLIELAKNQQAVRTKTKKKKKKQHINGQYTI